jgi:hypothetical protein
MRLAGIEPAGSSRHPATSRVVVPEWRGANARASLLTAAVANSYGCRKKHGQEASVPTVGPSTALGAARPSPKGSSPARKTPAPSGATDRPSGLCSCLQSAQGVAGADSPRVAAGGVVCAQCSRPIVPKSAWDLGHDDHDRTLYTGPEHARCNRGAPSRKRRANSVSVVPVDDPSRGVFRGPPGTSGQHVRWSTAWLDWRSDQG